MYLERLIELAEVRCFQCRRFIKSWGGAKPIEMRFVHIGKETLCFECFFGTKEFTPDIQLDKIQKEFGKWLSERIVVQESSLEDVLKMVEEIGEIAQLLKRFRSEDRIGEPEFIDAMEGEIADVTFCLMSICNHEGLKFTECVRGKWLELKDRPSVKGGK
jgi:NTP pyrophosphatase (non-canonical NTP hydrolase)